jgi:hypothetical protein
MYTNQQASQVQPQSITLHAKKYDTYTFIDILNSPEYTDKITINKTPIFKNGKKHFCPKL